MEQEIQSLLEKRAVEVVQDMLPSYWSTIFLIQKKGPVGGWRPVHNLKCLNKYLEVPHFKMETNKSILTAIQVGDWAVSLDLRDAYLHIPIHPAYRKYLRFHFKGTSYQFRVLPFGLATSPLVFTKVMAEVGVWARSHSLNLHMYPAGRLAR